MLSWIKQQALDNKTLSALLTAMGRIIDEHLLVLVSSSEITSLGLAPNALLASRFLNGFGEPIKPQRQNLHSWEQAN